jgi:magnesium-protoporphyrin O-methyltransferase
MFDARQARRNLDRYRRKGLDRLEQQLLDLVAARGVAGGSVLDIGGGIGMLQAELVEAGAARGEVLELVESYEPYARELAREKGLEERTAYRVGDLIADREVAEPADIVLLNRVVCCTPDGVGLTGAAASLTLRLLVLSFPRDRLLVRFGVRALNVGLRLLRRTFRAYAHRPARLFAAAEAEGLRVTARGGGRLWEFAALERV